MGYWLRKNLPWASSSISRELLSFDNTSFESMDDAGTRRAIMVSVQL
jgi:hypothetical protein